MNVSDRRREIDLFKGERDTGGYKNPAYSQRKPTRPRISKAVLGLVALSLITALALTFLLLRFSSMEGAEQAGRELAASQVRVAPDQPAEPATEQTSTITPKPSKRKTEAASVSRRTLEARPAPAPEVASEPVPASLKRSLVQAIHRSSSKRERVRMARTDQKRTFAIEPYRNGTVAKHLTGEELRLALLEDSRLTRQLNEAALRRLKTAQH